MAVYRPHFQRLIISHLLLSIKVKTLTDRHLGSVNLSPIENTFETENNAAFYPSKLDINCPEKEVMTQTVVRMIQKITDLSNLNLIKNADGLLLCKSTNVNVEWVRQTKKRLPPNKYKMSY